MKNPSKITASELILSAVFYLQQKNGVTEKEITKYICEKRGLKQSQIKDKVKKALERALNNGIFSKKKGLYRIENQFGQNQKMEKMQNKKTNGRSKKTRNDIKLGTTARPMEGNFEASFDMFETVAIQDTPNFSKGSLGNRNPSFSRRSNIFENKRSLRNICEDDDEEEKIYIDPFKGKKVNDDDDDDDDDDDFLEDEDDDDIDFFDDDSCEKHEIPLKKVCYRPKRKYHSKKRTKKSCKRRRQVRKKKTRRSRGKKCKPKSRKPAAQCCDKGKSENERNENIKLENELEKENELENEMDNRNENIGQNEDDHGDGYDENVDGNEDDRFEGESKDRKMEGHDAECEDAASDEYKEEGNDEEGEFMDCESEAYEDNNGDECDDNIEDEEDDNERNAGEDDNPGDDEACSNDNVDCEDDNGDHLCYEDHSDEDHEENQKIEDNCDENGDGYYNDNEDDYYDENGDDCDDNCNTGVYSTQEKPKPQGDCKAQEIKKERKEGFNKLYEENYEENCQNKSEGAPQFGKTKTYPGGAKVPGGNNNGQAKENAAEKEPNACYSSPTPTMPEPTKAQNAYISKYEFPRKNSYKRKMPHQFSKNDKSKIRCKKTKTSEQESTKLKEFNTF